MTFRTALCYINVNLNQKPFGRDDMEINEYQDLAMRTLNEGISKNDMLLNSVMGLCGESGEAIEILKKHIFHGRDLDRDHLIKELGDVAWYLAEAATALDIPLEEIFARNIEKLKARYPDGFSKERAINRAEDDI